MRLILASLALLATTSFGLAQERQWTLEASEKEAFLVFGVPDTDDVGISFWCEIGTNKISFFMTGIPAKLKQDQKVNVSVLVDGKTYTIKTKAALDKNVRLPSLEGSLPIEDPLMKAAAKTSSLTVTVIGHKNIYPMIDADVESLHRICAGAAVN